MTLGELNDVENPLAKRQKAWMDRQDAADESWRPIVYYRTKTKKLLYKIDNIMRQCSQFSVKYLIFDPVHIHWRD